jgi:hypothetical protein
MVAFSRDFKTALQVGADFLYVKPVSLTTLDQITRVMAIRWSLIWQAREGRGSSGGTPHGAGSVPDAP